MNSIKKLMHTLKWNLVKGKYKEFIKQGSNVIDIGAGDLYVSKLMERDLKCVVIGADIKDYGTDYVKHIIIDEDNKIDYPDNSFSVVTFNDVLHHIDEQGQKELIKEAIRIADKIIILEDAKNWVSYLLDFLTNRPSMPKALSHKNIAGWIKFFDDLELKSTCYKVKKPFWYPLKHYIFYV